jgi:hypothetical protein
MEAPTASGELELPLVAAAACIGGLAMLLSKVIRKCDQKDEAMQHMASHGATGPLLLFVSFLLVDQCIRFFATDAAYEANVEHAAIEKITVVTFTTMVFVTLLNEGLTSTQLTLGLFFAICVHSMIVITYSQMLQGSGSGRVVWSTSYGSYFFPARLNLWLHSSMSQILCFAASPRAVEQYGVATVLRRVRDVLVMFVFGFLCTMRPPSALTGHSGVAFTLATLFGSLPFFYRIVAFMRDALPLCLHVPEGSTASDFQRYAPPRSLLASNESASSSSSPHILLAPCQQQQQPVHSPRALPAAAAARTFSSRPASSSSPHIFSSRPGLFTRW